MTDANSNPNPAPADSGISNPAPAATPNLVSDATPAPAEGAPNPAPAESGTSNPSPADAAPDAAAMKAFLTGKDATLVFEGKTDEEIKGLFDAAKTKEAESAKPEDKKIVPNAPEKYADFTIAEGLTIPDTLKGQVEAMAKELDLPQDKAQKLFDLAPEISKMYQTQLFDAAATATKNWHTEAVADKEIGGGGDSKVLEANMAHVATARDAFATPELRKLLEPFNQETNPTGTGFGNHPEVVRLLMRVGMAMGEDKKFINGGGNSTSLSAAQKLYGNTK